MKNTGKKKATAKQKAWRAEFARRFGGGKKRGAKITHKSSTSMAKKKSRSSGSGFRGLAGRGGGLFKKAAAGVGGATIAAMLAANFAPQFAPMARLGGAYFGGGVEGVIADVVVSGGLGNLLGGGGGGNGSGDAL